MNKQLTPPKIAVISTAQEPNKSVLSPTQQPKSPMGILAQSLQEALLDDQRENQETKACSKQYLSLITLLKSETATGKQIEEQLEREPLTFQELNNALLEAPLSPNKKRLTHIKLLIKKGANKDACNENGDNILMLAVLGAQDGTLALYCMKKLLCAPYRLQGEEHSFLTSLLPAMIQEEKRKCITSGVKNTQTNLTIQALRSLAGISESYEKWFKATCALREYHENQKIKRDDVLASKLIKEIFLNTEKFKEQAKSFKGTKNTKTLKEKKLHRSNKSYELSEQESLTPPPTPKKRPRK